MNNNELLIRLIIPALFLLAWALNQVMNKDARPEPPQRGPLPDPFRNRLPPAQRPAGGTFVERFERTAPPPPRPSPMMRPGEEIVIVETETRPLRPPSAATATPTPSRPGRRNRNPRRPQPATPPSGTAAKKGEPARQSTLSNLATGLTGAPVNVPVGGINGMSPGIADADPRLFNQSPALDELRDAIASPDRIRQAILLNEILQPPLALRGRRPRR